MNFQEIKNTVNNDPTFKAAVTNIRLTKDGYDYEVGFQIDGRTDVTCIPVTEGESEDELAATVRNAVDKAVFGRNVVPDDSGRLT